MHELFHRNISFHHISASLRSVTIFKWGASMSGCWEALLLCVSAVHTISIVLLHECGQALNRFPMVALCNLGSSLLIFDYEKLQTTDLLWVTPRFYCRMPICNSQRILIFDELHNIAFFSRINEYNNQEINHPNCFVLSTEARLLYTQAPKLTHTHIAYPAE